jgi:hypothetical protein
MHHPTILKKLLIVWGASLLALISIGYLYYRGWQREVQKSDFLPYILSSSALVLDLPTVGKQWDTFQGTTIGQDLSTLPLCNHIKASLACLQQAGVDASVVGELPAVISIHGLGEEEVGYVIYVDLRIPKVATLVNAIEQPSNKHQVELRNYAGHTITAIDWSPGKSRTKLYMLKQQHHVMVSFSELLLEDIIRGLTHKDTAAFLKLPKSTHKQGSLFVNFEQLPALLRVFLTQESYATWASQLAGIAPQAQLELKLTDHYLLFNGVISNWASSPDKLYWVQTLSAEEPSSFGLASYIPVCAAVIQHYAIHDSLVLANNMQQYRYQQASSSDKKKQSISENTATLSSLHTLIKNELALCTLGTESHEQVLFVEVHNVEEAIASLEEAQCITYTPAHQLSKLSTIYTVNPTIFKTWLPQFVFPHFTPLFISTVDNYVVVANHFSALQALEAAYLQGATWAQQGSAQYQFLTSTLEAATFSMFVNMQAAHAWIAPYLKPVWKAIWHKNLAEFCAHGYASVQMTNSSTQEQPAGHINVLLAHVGEKEMKVAAVTEGTNQSDTAITGSTSFFQAEAPIVTSPMWVGTHKQEGSLLLVQDSLHQLYLISPIGQLIWKKQLDGPILPEVLLVDLYKNNKWQYLCATATSLHVIDYTGNEVNNFPRQLLTKGHGTAVNIIDYDNDKNYRILITDERGNIYLKDTQYRPLPGWNPKALQAPFAVTPLHLRVDKDYFVALQERGTLHVFNRRGQSYPGFPINVGEPVHNPLVIQQAKSTINTQLIILTDTGKLNTYNLKGALQSSVHLAKTKPAGKFTLVPNQVDKQHYVIFQQMIDKLMVLDERGQLLFERPCEADQTLIGQYYKDGSYKCYVVTDVEKAKTYIYDETGRLIHAPFNNSGYPIQLFWTSSSHQLTAYTTFGNQVHKYQWDVSAIDEVAQDVTNE